VANVMSVDQMLGLLIILHGAKTLDWADRGTVVFWTNRRLSSKEGITLRLKTWRLGLVMDEDV